MRCDEWRKALLGERYEGSVTDELSGESAGYSWYCDNVVQGLDDQIVAVLNDGKGNWKHFAVVEGDKPEGLADRVRTALEEEARQALAATRFDELTGAEL